MPPGVALIQAFIAGVDPEFVRDAVERLAVALPHRPAAGDDAHERLNVLRDLLAENRAGCDALTEMLRTSFVRRAEGEDLETAIRACSARFDALVARSEETSVAAYSLGNAQLLAQATGEVVAAFRAWGLLGRDRHVLQIGCGIGRFERVLAPEVGMAYGIDISPGMIAAARRRCADLANVEFSVCSGRDLQGFATRSIDLVYAVDSFPYIHEMGAELVADHVREAARVLRVGGDFAILSFSYAREFEADRSELEALSAAHDFDIVRAIDAPFRHWDGRAFHLRRA